MFFPGFLLLLMTSFCFLRASMQMNVLSDPASSENFVNSIYNEEADSLDEPGVNISHPHQQQPTQQKVIFPTPAAAAAQAVKNTNQQESARPLGFLDAWLKKVPNGLLRENQQNNFGQVPRKRLVLKRHMKFATKPAPPTEPIAQTITKVSCNCSTSACIIPSNTETSPNGTTNQIQVSCQQINNPPVQRPNLKPIQVIKTSSTTTSASTTAKLTTSFCTQFVSTATFASQVITATVATSATTSQSKANVTCCTMTAGCACACPKPQTSQKIIVDKGKVEKIHIKAEKPDQNVTLVEKEMCKLLYAHDQHHKEMEKTTHEDIVDMQDVNFFPIMRALFVSFMRMISKVVDKQVAIHDKKILKAQCEILKHALPQTFVDTRIIKQTFTTSSIYSVTIPQLVQCITYDTRTITMTQSPTTTSDDEKEHLTTVPGNFTVITLGPSAIPCVPCCAPCYCPTECPKPTATVDSVES